MHSQGKILHLFGWDKKFVPPFIAFLREHFDETEHCFIIYGQVNDAPIPTGANVLYYPSLLKNLTVLLAQIRAAKKVILHGLFSSHLFYALALQPWALKKCYWTIWGGDLYIHNAEIKDWRSRKDEWFRRFVLSRLGHLITHIKGDYKLAHQWYGTKGQWHECFLYPSNLYHELPITISKHSGINILVGNSADPSNNHKEILDILHEHVHEDIKIFCPLSYGNKKNADEIEDYAINLFGNKFIALREMIPHGKYIEFLNTIDIAIFNHNRQQGMGNITSLLGLEKKIYMRAGVTSFEALKNISIEIYNIADFKLSKIDEKISKNNKIIISKYFSINNLIRQWRNIFKDE